MKRKICTEKVPKKEKKKVTVFSPRFSMDWVSRASKVCKL